MNRIQRRLQKIERAVDPVIDSFLGRIGDKIRPTMEKLDINLESTVMWCFAKLDGLSKRCPRCHMRWSPKLGRKPYQITRYHCKGCVLMYEPENAAVVCVQKIVSVHWDLVDRKCEVRDSHRTYDVVWLPYDFSASDIDKYLVLV